MMCLMGHCLECLIRETQVTFVTNHQLENEKRREKNPLFNSSRQKCLSRLSLPVDFSTDTFIVRLPLCNNSSNTSASTSIPLPSVKKSTVSRGRPSLSMTKQQRIRTKYPPLKKQLQNVIWHCCGLSLVVQFDVGLVNIM